MTMKNITKTFLTTVILVTVISFAVNAQTNVSGGIYSNTTWTLANSPYTVTDTVVVFPGVTLTIQPGVVVKFDSAMRLEIRQAKLIAIGTNTDSITFTSSSSSPTPGIWDEIYLNGGSFTSKFNFCNFRYANYALYNFQNQLDTLIIKNSSFRNNNVGPTSQALDPFVFIDSCIFRNNTIYGLKGIGGGITQRGEVNHCNISYNQTGLSGAGVIVKNCVIDSNQTGLYVDNAIVDKCFINGNQYGLLDGATNTLIKNSTINSNSILGIKMGGGGGDEIDSCVIKYNEIGIDDITTINISKNIIENNTIGIQMSVPYGLISCNKICNNSSYDLKYSGTSNFTVANNYWCTSDSASTEAVIYDGYDNVNYGLVSFMPIDTLQCYLTTGISENVLQKFSFNIFPNPASDYLTIAMPANVSKAEIKIYNLLGELEYSSIDTKQSTNIDVSTLASGLHIIQIATGNNISRQKFIKQ